MMNGKKCFSVQCSGNTTTCQEVRADSSLSISTIAYVARYVDSEHTQGTVGYSKTTIMEKQY
jgi:hypothetical protein